MSSPSPLSKQPKSQNWRIEHLPGLSHDVQSQLKALGIQTTLQLLQHGRTPDLRQKLAAQIHIHIQHVNKWFALAELACIPSVGCQYCGLILHAGIGSTHQLAKTPPQQLHQRILRLHVANLRRSNLCPQVHEVIQWVEQAKRLQPLQ